LVEIRRLARRIRGLKAPYIDVAGHFRILSHPVSHELAGFARALSDRFLAPAHAVNAKLPDQLYRWPAFPEAVRVKDALIHALIWAPELISAAIVHVGKSASAIDAMQPDRPARCESFGGYVVFHAYLLIFEYKAVTDFEICSRAPASLRI
jgi:hypothetical protein